MPTGAAQDLIYASKVNGTAVLDSAGERIGHVEDVAIGKTDGRVAYALLAFGGVLGLGEKLFPIPWSILTYDPARNGYVTPLTRADLPEAPGLGIEVDEDALERYRMEPPYEHPKPRLILSVRRASGLTTHYASIWDCWREFGKGNEPVDERGVRMHVREDDGSGEWSELFERAKVAPVREYAAPG